MMPIQCTLLKFLCFRGPETSFNGIASVCPPPRDKQSKNRGTHYKLNILLKPAQSGEPSVQTQRQYYTPPSLPPLPQHSPMSLSTLGSLPPCHTDQMNKLIIAGRQFTPCHTSIFSFISFLMSTHSLFPMTLWVTFTITTKTKMTTPSTQTSESFLAASNWFKISKLYCFYL